MIRTVGPTRYAIRVSSPDTTPDAAAVQTAIYRRMSPDQRCELAAHMSVSAREITLSGIHSRHPAYNDRDARLALYRLLLGDVLFREAYPGAPLLEP